MCVSYTFLGISRLVKGTKSRVVVFRDSEGVGNLKMATVVRRSDIICLEIEVLKLVSADRWGLQRP